MNIPEVSLFPIGGANEAFAQYFIGQSYLNMLSTEQVIIGNVTFEPKCRNNWHIHHADKDGGQMLLVTAGEGSLKFHLSNAKIHGVTKEEIAEILTHAAFYAGWPKAWAALRMAKEIWEG